jgi:thiol-disulfide isomerase/thioredoxin
VLLNGTAARGLAATLARRSRIGATWIVLATALAGGCSKSAGSEPKAPEPLPMTGVGAPGSAAKAQDAPPASASPASPERNAEGRPEEKEDGPAWLGVELATVPPDQAGVLVRDVTRDSPAERAGLAAGDVIVSLDGEAVSRPNEVVRVVSLRKPGARLSVGFRRGTSDRLVAAVLGARPDVDAMMQKNYVGSQAPAFGDLTVVQGSVPPSVSSLRGKVVVVEFWASWCVPCRMTAPKLNRWHERWGAQGLEVVGVTTDPAVFATQAAVEFGIHYAVASDESGQTSRAYRAMSIPTLFVIDRAGVVREVVVGYSPDRLAQAERLVEQLVTAR